MDQVEKVLMYNVEKSLRPKLSFLGSSLVALRLQYQASSLFSGQQIHKQETKAKVKVDDQSHHHC